jgi:hypothetical protein
MREPDKHDSNDSSRSGQGRDMPGGAAVVTRLESVTIQDPDAGTVRFFSDATQRVSVSRVGLYWTRVDGAGGAYWTSEPACIAGFRDGGEACGAAYQAWQAMQAGGT